MNLLKEQFETLKDYKIRLFRNKDKYSLSNKDIAELLNSASNSNKDESSYRKWYKAYQEGYDDGINNTLGDSAILHKLEDKRLETEKIRQQAQTQRIETNRWIREQAREELFYDTVEDKMREYLSNMPKIRSVKNEHGGAIDGVLFLSDQHYGIDFKVYDLDNNILNEYSPEIFETRMETILWDTINQIDKYNLKKISIICLGDSLDGHLRNSQLIKLRWGVIDCAIKYAQYMLSWLIELSKYVNIDFYNTSGNHTELRLLDGKKGEHERENLDKVIMSIIKSGVEITKNPNINIIENNTGYVFTTLEASKYTIFGLHGETNNLESTLKDFSTMYDKKIDYIAAGHLHHCDIKLFGHRQGTLRIGSIIGCDDFSVKLRKRADANTNFMIFEKNKGLVDVHNIILN